VGHATHYHADYVLPYWADSLLKQVQIGHHIFYRLRGGLGSSAAFSQRYAGTEPAPPAPSTLVLANDAANQAQELLNPTPPGPPPLTADAAGLAAAGEPKQILLADANKGELLIDRGAAPARKVRPAEQGCAAETDKKRALPAAPDDLRVRSPSDGC
jgi:hypothetical protein